MTESVSSSLNLFVIAVLLMALVTYTMRAGGYWFMGRIPLTDRVRKALEALPGAIIVSTILPIAMQGGLTVFLCLLVAAAVMLIVRQDVIAVACAVTAAAVFRSFGM